MGKGTVVNQGALMFSKQVFTDIHVFSLNPRFKSFRCTLNDPYLVIF